MSAQEEAQKGRRRPRVHATLKGSEGEFEFPSVDFSMLERVQISLSLDLKPGVHRIPLWGNETLVVDVPLNGCCHIEVSAGIPETEDTGLMVNAVELSFERPLVINEILLLLASLQTRFSDKKVAALAERLTQSVARNRLLAGLSLLGGTLAGKVLEGLGSSPAAQLFLKEKIEPLLAEAEQMLRRSARVLLSKVTARPVDREGTPELEMRFSGEWEWAGSVRIPFHDVRVHRVILPAPHALVEKLVSGEPLASARLIGEPSPMRELATCLAGIVESFRGTAVLLGPVPEVLLDVFMADDGRLSIGVVGPEKGRMRCVVSGRLGNELEAEIEELSVLAGCEQVELHGRCKVSGEGDVTAKCVKALFDGKWGSEGMDIKAELELAKGSSAPLLRLSFDYSHPLLRGQASVPVQLEGLRLDGSVRFGLGAGAFVELVDLKFEGGLEIGSKALIDLGSTSFTPEVSGGRFEGSIRSSGRGVFQVKARGRASARVRGETKVEAFPELSIEEGVLLTLLDGRIELNMKAVARVKEGNPLEMDFAGTTTTVELSEGTIQLGEKRLVLPAAARIMAAVEEGHITASGVGRASTRLEWDFNGRSPMLYAGARSAELFVDELRQGDFLVHISPSGGITVSGPEKGLYDARYFNALLNPEQEIKRIAEILRSDEALERIFAALEILAPRLVKPLTQLKDFVRKVGRILEEEGVRMPGDVIPANKFARLIAKTVFNDPEVEQNVQSLLRRVIEGKGLDVRKLKRLLQRLPKHQWEFEIQSAVKLAALLLKPGKLPAVGVKGGNGFGASDTALSHVPLPDLSEYREKFAGLPAALDVYRILESGEAPPEGFFKRVASLAHYYSLEQVEYLLAKGKWDESDLARLKRLHDIKSRVRCIASEYGGIGYAPQGLVISFFLAETIRMSRPTRGLANKPLSADEDWLVPGCLLGPEDAAVLMQAGLASAWAGRVVQLNQRMLLDLILELPPMFVAGTLAELGRNDPRVLTQVLNALLTMPQDAMRSPLDLVERFSDKLGIPFPRRSDFMAGGKRAGDSYYEELAKTADRVLALAVPYRALKSYLQEARRPVGTGYFITPEKAKLERAALKAIEKADQRARRYIRSLLGQTMEHRPPAINRIHGQNCGGNLPVQSESGTPPRRKWLTPAQRRKCINAYFAAFDACAKLLELDRCAFQLKWFSDFWRRNHEALVVLSVVRNIQEGVDRTRQWLKARLGAAVPDDEQALVDAVIDALYYFEEDRRQLKGDPLVRLLIDPPEGKYDFTIVSCMGVITRGEKGSELEETFRRLRKKRGIKVLRAHTATARSLEFNAARVIETVSKVKTPWGYIGYSQGCANALMAESRLMAADPSRHRLLDGLVSRNLLFSAFNGSAHGTCSDEKFYNTMVFMDRFLSHYQAMLSSRAINTALSVIRFLLDSPLFILSLLGMRSLSVWGVLPLHQEGQFKDGVPTSSVRGVVTPDILPEALEFLSNVLTVQLGTHLHDTQVSVTESQAHSVLVDNAATQVLKRCDIPCLVQRCHHWSPVKKETEVVTTKKDRARAVYDFPKDRHVFPWIEVNARFGLIRKRQTASRTPINQSR